MDLSYIPLTLVEDKPLIQLEYEDVETNLEIWRNVLVVYIVGKLLQFSIWIDMLRKIRMLLLSLRFSYTKRAIS